VSEVIGKMSFIWLPVAALARRNVGTPVFGGMILASFIGIFAIPPLYVAFQALRERLRPAFLPAGNSLFMRLALIS
jgi:hypothetical protein